MNKKQVGCFQNLKSFFSYWFSVQDIDDHYVIKFFGAKICKKHKVNYEFKEVTEYGLTTEKRNPKLIVSLTTFPARINTVYKTVSTLLNQTLKPDEVVLWLADSQFPNRELPENLTRLQQFGLSIKWCEDIRSYKKLIPTLIEFPEDIVVTVDDDNYYDSKLLESLYNSYLENPECIHARQAFVVKINNKLELSMHSRSYVYDNTYLPSYFNEPVGCGGVLYPPKSLHPNVLNKEQFMDIIPTNDDIWFWGHALRNGTKIKVLKNNYKLKMYVVENTQEKALWRVNMDNTVVGMSGNNGVNLMYNMFEEVKANILSERKSNFIQKLKSFFFRTLNSIVKLCLELFVFNKRTRRKLKGNFCKWYLKNYIDTVENRYIEPKYTDSKPYRIWQYWDSGVENAPEIVKACMASVEKYKGDIERVILTKDNIKDYVNIPEFIYRMRDKGIIKAAHFADILRTCLLVEYGGCWIDATVYLTEPLPDYIRNSELFVLQNDETKDYDGLNMANYFISSKGNSVILRKMRDFLYLYWSLNDFKFNYFFYLHAFTMFTKSSDINRQEWESMKKVSFLSAQVMQDKLLNKYDEEEFDKLKKLSPIHKLTYKKSVLSKKKNIDTRGTLYEYILNK
ncbi:MAG: capsular polysaccharide synthesis protein [Candidatus Gastranaerophilaceae bacterium]